MRFSKVLCLVIFCFFYIYHVRVVCGWCFEQSYISIKAPHLIGRSLPPSMPDHSFTLGCTISTRFINIARAAVTQLRSIYCITSCGRNDILAWICNKRRRAATKRRRTPSSEREFYLCESCEVIFNSKLLPKLISLYTFESGRNFEERRRKCGVGMHLSAKHTHTHSLAAKHKSYRRV